MITKIRFARTETLHMFGHVAAQYSSGQSPAVASNIWLGNIGHFYYHAIAADFLPLT